MGTGWSGITARREEGLTALIGENEIENLKKYICSTAKDYVKSF